jgi:hypothetical protein
VIFGCEAEVAVNVPVIFVADTFVPDKLPKNVCALIFPYSFMVTILSVTLTLEPSSN